MSIAIDADLSFFQLYNTSVITAMCETELDHGVLAVGYGTECGTDEWKVNFVFLGGSSGCEQGHINLQRAGR